MRAAGPFPRKGAEKMRRMILLGCLLLAGCRGVVGPFEHRRPERVDDPRLSTSEQQRRGRDRMALPVESPAVGPLSGIEGLPGPHGR
jgi:hypothetical protein